MISPLDSPVSKYFFVEQNANQVIPTFAFRFREHQVGLKAMVMMNKNISMYSDNASPNKLSFIGNMGMMTSDELIWMHSLPKGEQSIYRSAHMQPLIRLGYSLSELEQTVFCDAFDRSHYFGLVLVTPEEAFRVLMDSRNGNTEGGRALSWKEIPNF
jgi:hypothetical protein